MRRYKSLAAVMAAAMVMGSLAGCGAKEQAPADTTAPAADTAEENTEAAAEDASEEAEETAEEAAEEPTEEVTKVEADNTEVRVGSLKGPTTMGLVNLMNASEAGEAKGNYTFTMATQPDEISTGVAAGDFDIALVPANLASVLYNKTEGGVEVLDINTLGVLYCVTGDDSIHSVTDLAGKTIITTGQGATPEYSINYLLDANGVTDCTVEFKSEATEIAAVLKNDPMQIAVLPQPFVTAAEAQNEALHTAFSLSDEWDDAAGGESRMVTGVTIVRKAFLEEHEGAVMQFMAEQAESAAKAGEDVEGTAELVAKYGIIEKAPVAKKALPQCGITFIDGEEMQTALSGYLNVLAQQNPKAVGGKVPDEAFYFIAK